MKRITILAATAGLALAACGSSNARGSSSATATGKTGTTAVVGSATTMVDVKAGADAEFAQGMIAHHEQAIEMADMALDPKASASTPVKDLATRIKAAQDPEITQMKTWLTKMAMPMQMDTAAGHGMSGMAGMMSTSDMDALGKKTGKDFDKAWLDMMIAHHAGAITMSETLKANGTDPEMKKLADTLITAQQKEIGMMKALGGA